MSRAFSVKRWYEALIVEREASLGAERYASMKRALAQERKANVKRALASSVVSGPRFARPCTMLSTMLTLASSVGVKRKCQVLLVSSVAQSAGVLASGLQYVLTCVVKHKCRSGGSSESRIVFSYVLVIGST